MVLEGALDRSLSVVLPMYNEEAGAASAVGSICGSLEKIVDDFEILLIESGSTDRTAEIADSLAVENPRVRVIHQISREGLGSAIRLGFANARKEYILYLDADEPFEVSEIAKVIPLLAPGRAVIGYRIGERENLKRKVLSKVYNALVQALFGLGVRDVNFSMKVIHRDTLKRLRLRADGCFYDAELVAELRKAGVEIVETGFEYTHRTTGISSLDRVSVIADILWEMTGYFLGRWLFSKRPRRAGGSS